MKLRVALAQLAPHLGDLSANLELHLDWIARARAQRADLIVFPELSLTGYILQDLVSDLALPLPCPELKPLLTACQDIDCVFGFVQVTERFKFYNAAAYVSSGRVTYVHRKLYLPTYGMFDEMRFFAMGERLRSFETRFGKVGLLICEDLWHPSTIYLHAQDGACLVITVSCSPGRGIRNQTGLFSTSVGWEHLLQATAQFHTVFNVYVNRVGYEDGANFPGGSLVVGPSGELVSKAKYFEEDLVITELDMDELRRARLFTPVLRDERLELTMIELQRIIKERTGWHDSDAN